MNQKILQISEINATELMEYFNSLKTFIDDKIKTKETEENITLLTTPETLEFLKVAPQTLTNWVNGGLITRYKLGNKVYYKKEEIIKNLENTKHANRLH